MNGNIKLTGGGSYYLRGIPAGCKYCMNGSKIVVFITGRCFTKCFYCPLSEKRKNGTQIYANEVQVNSVQDLIREAELIEAEGAGLTGGDPLYVFDETVKYIGLLKKHFGSKFHIHLYTTGHNLTSKRADTLIRSGLDEIRFHPSGAPLSKLKLFKDSAVKFGVEVPAIPGDEANLKKLIIFLEELGADFININELEFSDTNADELIRRGLKLKRGAIAAADGSQKTALKLLEWCDKNTEEIMVHYCPAELKDKVQLKNRFIRRGRNVRRPYEELDEEGLLIRGVIYLSEKHSIEGFRRLLVDKYEVPEEMIELDPLKKQIITAWYIVKELSKELAEKKVRAGIIKSYPTDDRFIVMSYYL